MEVGIEVTGLRKRFGHTVALDGLSFTVTPGNVTGFVGPNGAGKSTTMRVILGLDAVDEGTALIGGRPYASLRSPLTHVGSLLDAGALHPGRSARSHLLWMAHSQGLSSRRVDEVIEQAGLGAVARRKAGGYSLGMRQRLGVAAAMLGDPPVVMLDEPFNGLDPEGIVWMRSFLRSLATEGRAVFVSSHLMSELEGTATHLIVIGRGRLVADEKAPGNQALRFGQLRAAIVMNCSQRFAFFYVVADALVKFQPDRMIDFVFLGFAASAQHGQRHAKLFAIRPANITARMAGNRYMRSRRW